MSMEIELSDFQGVQAFSTLVDILNRYMQKGEYFKLHTLVGLLQRHDPVDIAMLIDQLKEWRQQGQLYETSD